MCCQLEALNSVLKCSHGHKQALLGGHGNIKAILVWSHLTGDPPGGNLTPEEAARFGGGRDSVGRAQQAAAAGLPSPPSVPPPPPFRRVRGPVAVLLPIPHCVISHSEAAACLAAQCKHHLRAHVRHYTRCCPHRHLLTPHVPATADSALGWQRRCWRLHPARTAISTTTPGAATCGSPFHSLQVYHAIGQ